MSQKLCRDCTKCNESAISSLGKKTANGVLIASTAGMSVLASKTAGAFRKRCPICGHFLSEHHQGQQLAQATEQSAPPQQPISTVPPHRTRTEQTKVGPRVLPSPADGVRSARAGEPNADVSQIQPEPKIVRCDYCRRPNPLTNYTCAGCSAPLPIESSRTAANSLSHEVLFYYERVGLKFSIFGDRIEIVEGLAGGNLEGAGTKVQGLGGVASGLRKQKVIRLTDVVSVSVGQLGARLQMRLSDGTSLGYLLGFRTKEAHDCIVESKR